MNFCLVLSGGIGSRLGSNIPKQYIKIGNQPIINYSLNTFSSISEIDAIIVVAASKYYDLILKYYDKKKKLIFADAGKCRQESVLNGLKKISPMIDSDNSNSKNYVLIHDAARPNVKANLVYKLSSQGYNIYE